MTRVITAIVFVVILGVTNFLSSTLRADDAKESQELRMLAGSTFTNAWKDANLGKHFTDNDVKNAFDPDRSVVAVLLRLTYRGKELHEISISNSLDGNSKVFAIKTLSADHADAKLIKRLLKL